MRNKVLRGILTGILVAGNVMIVNADTIETSGGELQKEVQATYNPAKTTQTVYNVDVTWGSMEFTYTEEYVGDWDAQTHQYVNSTPAVWSCEEKANQITVVNHSNVDITAEFKYVANNGYEDIKGTFSDEKLDLKTAVGTKIAEAPSGISFLTLSGALAKDTESLAIGTVIVTIK